MNAAQSSLAPASDRQERLRQQAGLVLAPAVFLVLWFVPFAGLAMGPHRLLAVTGAVVVLWITEAIPLPVTGLIGPVACVLVGVGSARDVFRSFADPIVFLLLGSFLLAEAMAHHGLNRRIAFRVLAWPAVGRKPGRILIAFAALTAFISMWVSNTATTAMMAPIALAVLGEIARRQSEERGVDVPVRQLGFATALMLLTSFAASLGGLGTPVGTPTNLIGIGLLEQRLHFRITFFQWISIGLPVAAMLTGFLLLVFRGVTAATPNLSAEHAGWIQTERAKLGSMRPGERNALLAFAITAGLWILPGCLALALGNRHHAVLWMNGHLPEGVVALIGGLLLFLLPVNLGRGEFTMGWEQAKQIDWGTLLLFGGGLAIGELMFSTGLAQWLGERLGHLLHGHSMLGFVALFTAMAIILSETTSNVASATMIVPVAIAVAQAAGVDPVPPAVAACLAASMGFMLPVSTPPNAIVYASGCVPLMKMVRYGVLLDLAAFLVIVPFSTWAVPILLQR